MSESIGSYIRALLAVPGAPVEWSVEDLEWVLQATEQATARAFAGDAAAAEDLHRAAYAVFVARHRSPWDPALPDVGNPIIATFLWVFAREWDRADRLRYRDTLSAVPADPGQFAEWITGLVRRHECNFSHPLFEFLSNEASFAQLREYVYQETPQDLFFADVLTSLLPGIYGEPKMEIADNFWDETGCGDPAKVHRKLRLDLMRRLDLSIEDAGDVDSFAIEEIELANAYFVGTADRSRAVLLIGMLLATESLAPGRLQKQIDGWRRVGLADEDMSYLLEHTVVDVEHGEHWMEHVVKPIVAEQATAKADITLGALRRLDLAASVCDRMVDYLREPRVEALAG